MQAEAHLRRKKRKKNPEAKRREKERKEEKRVQLDTKIQRALESIYHLLSSLSSFPHVQTFHTLNCQTLSPNLGNIDTDSTVSKLHTNAFKLKHVQTNKYMDVS